MRIISKLPTCLSSLLMSHQTSLQLQLLHVKSPAAELCACEMSADSLLFFLLFSWENTDIIKNKNSEIMSYFSLHHWE